MIASRRVLRVGLDLDGVLYDEAAALREWLYKTGVRKPGTLADPIDWLFYETQWGMSEGEFYGHMADAVREHHVFRVGEPSPGSVASVRRLAKAGHTIHIVTARLHVAGVDELVRTHTVDWLTEWEIPYQSLTFSNDKTSEMTDVFLDDSPSHYDSLERAGCSAVLWSQPWNESHQGLRVRTFEEFENVVLEISSKPASRDPTSA